MTVIQLHEMNCARISIRRAVSFACCLLAEEGWRGRIAWRLEMLRRVEAHAMLQLEQMV